MVWRDPWLHVELHVRGEPQPLDLCGGRGGAWMPCFVPGPKYWVARLAVVPLCLMSLRDAYATSLCRLCVVWGGGVRLGPGACGCVCYPEVPQSCKLWATEGAVRLQLGMGVWCGGAVWWKGEAAGACPWGLFVLHVPVRIPGPFVWTPGSRLGWSWRHARLSHVCASSRSFRVLL
jgi:hypothetical protein